MSVTHHERNTDHDFQLIWLSGTLSKEDRLNSWHVLINLIPTCDCYNTVYWLISPILKLGSSLRFWSVLWETAVQQIRWQNTQRHIQHHRQSQISLNIFKVKSLKLANGMIQSKIVPKVVEGNFPKFSINLRGNWSYTFLISGLVSSDFKTWNILRQLLPETLREKMREWYIASHVHNRHLCNFFFCSFISQWVSFNCTQAMILSWNETLGLSKLKFTKLYTSVTLDIR